MKRIGFLFTDCGSFVRLPEDVIMAEIPDSKDKRFTDARGFMSPSIAELVATKAERERGCILLLCKLDIRIFSIPRCVFLCPPNHSVIDVSMLSIYFGEAGAH